MRDPKFLRLRRAFLIGAAAIPFAGCGYHFTAPYDRSVRTVFVPIVKCQSFRREINLQLTELVIKEIERRTPYKVVGSPEGADTLLEGTIQFADKNTVVESPYNIPRGMNGSITVAVKFTHNPPTAEEQKRATTQVQETVNFVPEVGETTETAFYRVCFNIATQIVDMMESPWYRDIKGD